MKALKKLTGETVIYGLPTIVGRLLNWCLNPYWTYVFINQAELGKVSYVYAVVAFLLVFLIYGMETGFFRFASKEDNKDKVFSTSLISIGSTTLMFLLLVFIFKDNFAEMLKISGRSDFILIMGITVALDIISSIPFAKLRIQHRPIKFSALKFTSIGINIFFNLFFLSFCPYIIKNNPDSFLNLVYHADFGIGYIFLSNLISSLFTFILLIPEFKAKWNFDFSLFKRMFKYSYPILIVGITGFINQNIDKILIPNLLPETSSPMKQLGIYVSAFKLAVLLNVFIQAFRFAFEPFIFSQKEGKESKDMYVIVMKYFSILGLIIFLGMSTFSDLIMNINAKGYREAVGVIPIILLANFFMGIFFTQSLWYKLTDKTIYGAYFGILGSVITIALNIILIPKIGYYGSAIAILACFVVMTVVSYIYGQKYYPINYDLKSFGFYLFLSLILFLIYWLIRKPGSPYYLVSVILNVIFLAVIYFKEKNDFKRIFKLN
jgi:O-antigen/teichoic acid export membrane protein